MFRTAETGEAPDPLAVGNFLHDPPITESRDDSQIRTRVYGKGHGEQTLAEVAAGATVLPLGDVTMFSPTGGKAISEAQVFAYSGRDLGGTGGLRRTGRVSVGGAARRVRQWTRVGRLRRA